MISGFNGANFFLSNFYVLPFEYKGLLVQSAENAFQANKTLDPVERMAIAMAPTPAEAKRLGRICTMRSNWDVYRDQVMLDVVRTKFLSDYGLAKKLLETGTQRLVETNHWGDRYWGVYNGEGLNKLGLTLEIVRGEVAAKDWFV
jgi:ribA/ribD-fused uncharacterized protein